MNINYYYNDQDAREFWETTQNPIVYRISGAWESMTAPTEEGMAVAEIQKLDPDFVKVRLSLLFDCYYLI